MNRYSDEKDDILVELTLLGNEEAYEELVLRHENAVKGSAYKVTGNRFSAEDASQDAFVTAWMHLDSLRERTRFGPWVAAIARNCAKNLARHYRSVAADISLDLLENIEATAFDESGLSSLLNEACMNEADRDETLRAAVEALSEKIRETVKLHYFEEKSVSEIAELLSLPVGTVKWRLSEGRKQLRKEYGVLEKTYDENEPLVARVMRQVEELKLWLLKNDKTGFEAEYRRVLANVEALEDSMEKEHALAEVLLHGYWWIPGQKNKEVLSRIKKAAERSRNEDVMQNVMASEHGEYRGEVLLNVMREREIPYLEAIGMKKTQGYVWFWYGYQLFQTNRDAEAEEAMRRVLSLLFPTDVYYANVLSALRVFEQHKRYKNEWSQCAYGVTGEVYRYIGGKLCFWNQPGFSYSNGTSFDNAIFWNASRCDHLLFDPSMKVGEVYTASDGRNTLTYEEDGVTVETPAGRFENCRVWVSRGNFYGITSVETVFCAGVGIVRQRVRRDSSMTEWVLKSAVVKGGEGLVPFAPGNVWEYDMIPEIGTLCETVNRFEVLSYEIGTAVVSAYAFRTPQISDRTIWRGNILAARRNYWREFDGKHEELISVEDDLRGAAALAVTKREKLHTTIATDVMNRIFATDPTANPMYTEKGGWNFFDVFSVEKREDTVRLISNSAYSFEWKDMKNCGIEGYPVLYNFVYDILMEAMGCIFSEAWVPGYQCKNTFDYYGKHPVELDFRVLEDETVTTPAGRFENCRHVSYHLKGLNGGLGYRGFPMEYWFAPQIGIVAFRAFYKTDRIECVWELTAFRGTGEGYFPAEDGLFRRYEPRCLVNGWHGSVEYTYDGDENGVVIFRNALGTQDRANYEADLKKREEERKKNSP